MYVNVYKRNPLHSVNEQGKNKKLRVTHQCCRGFARSNTNDVHSACEKVELHSIEETATTLKAKEFIAMSKKSGMDFAKLSNVTVFLPIDSYFSELTPEVTESVRWSQLHIQFHFILFKCLLLFRI